MRLPRSSTLILFLLLPSISEAFPVSLTCTPSGLSSCVGHSHPAVVSNRRKHEGGHEGLGKAVADCITFVKTRVFVRPITSKTPIPTTTTTPSPPTTSVVRGVPTSSPEPSDTAIVNSTVPPTPPSPAPSTDPGPAPTAPPIPPSTSVRDISPPPSSSPAPPPPPPGPGPEPSESKCDCPPAPPPVTETTTVYITSPPPSSSSSAKSKSKAKTTSKVKASPTSSEELEVFTTVINGGTAGGGIKTITATRVKPTSSGDVELFTTTINGGTAGGGIKTITGTRVKVQPRGATYPGMSVAVDALKAVQSVLKGGESADGVGNDSAEAAVKTTHAGTHTTAQGDVGDGEGYGGPPTTLAAV